MDWSLKEIDDQVRRMIRTRVSGETFEKHRLSYRMKFMRFLYIKTVLAHGRLIWNESDRHAVTQLIESDLPSCSPEAIRLVVNTRSHDARKGDWAVCQIAARGIPALAIIGTQDRLTHPTDLIRDAQLLNAEIVLVENASHFVYLSDLEAVVQALERKFAQ
jgi:pimeloyl-ACP methyl ester carboxylesterase